MNLKELGATYYTGNCHKWICAPKGSGFLWARADLQPRVRPTVTSHGANSARTDRGRYLLEFDWVGTDDPTAYLAVPSALELLASLLPSGWPELRARNRALALEARTLLCAELGIAPPSPDELVGSMAAIPLPPSPRSDGAWPDPLTDELYEELRIEVPVFPFPAAPARILRVSAQAYNTREEYAYLAEALVERADRRPGAGH